MSSDLLAELNQTFQRHQIQFKKSVAGLEIPEPWIQLVSNPVNKELLQSYWQPLYNVMPEPLEHFFSFVWDITLIEKASNRFSLGYVLKYKSGRLAVFEGQLPATVDKNLDILPSALRDFYTQTHNGFSFSPTINSVFLPSDQWFSIKKEAYEVTDGDERQMGVQLEKIIIFYELAPLVYIGWDPVTHSHVLIDLKYKQTELNIDVISELEPYFFNSFEYLKPL